MNIEEAPALTEEEEKQARAESLESANRNAVEKFKITLLHASARLGEEGLTRELLNLGFDVNAQDGWGRTPLRRAIHGQHRRIVLMLLAAGADMSLQSEKKLNVLPKFFAIHSLKPAFCRAFLRELRRKCSSSEAMAQLMIDAGCQFYQAAFAKNTRIIKYMLEQGSPMDSAHPTCKTTALHVAVMVEDVKIVKLLLRRGADATALDHEGASPLCYVYRYNTRHTAEKIAILRILLGVAASPTSLTLDGTFQVWPTLMYGNFEAISEILRSDHFDFAAKDRKNSNLLHYLATNINSRIAEQLEEHIGKLDVNAVNEAASSPLRRAALHSNVEMMKFLLEHGAEVDCKPSERAPALYCVCERSKIGFAERDDRCAELLLQHNANPQLVESVEGITILNLLLKCHSRDRVKLVVSHLAMLHARGETIIELILAQIESHRTLRKYFNECKAILRRSVAESVTVAKLLAADKNKMARYLGNGRLVLKLKRLSYKHKLKSSYPYYWNTLLRRFSKGMEYRKLKNGASEAISAIFDDCLQKTDLIVDKTIEYLNDQDLEKLCRAHRLER